MTAAAQMCHRVAFTVRSRFQEQNSSWELKKVAHIMAKAVMGFWQSIEVYRYEVVFLFCYVFAFPSFVEKQVFYEGVTNHALVFLSLPWLSNSFVHWQLAWIYLPVGLWNAITPFFCK